MGCDLVLLFGNFIFLKSGGEKPHHISLSV